MKRSSAWLSAHHHHTHTAKGSSAMLSSEVRYQPKGRRLLWVSVPGVSFKIVQVYINFGLDLQLLPPTAPNVACHTCAASMLSTRLQMPIGATEIQLMSQYSSLTSSCGIATMSVTPLATTTTWVTL